MLSLLILVVCNTQSESYLICCIIFDRLLHDPTIRFSSASHHQYFDTASFFSSDLLLKALTKPRLHFDLTTWSVVRVKHDMQTKRPVSQHCPHPKSRPSDFVVAW